MNIITLITKKSIREIIKNRKFLFFFSLKLFKAGDMIEIIEGNKKSQAIILKINNTLDLKEKIRAGDIEIKKLKLSKTGNYSSGKIIEKFNIEDIKKYIRDYSLSHKQENILIKNFFPKKRKKVLGKISHNTKIKTAQSISEILKTKNKFQVKSYNNEMQELVDVIRTYFSEKAIYGQGSFSYYIGFFKQVPLGIVFQYFSEVKQTKKSLFGQKKLFWYKIGKYIKEKK